MANQMLTIATMLERVRERELEGWFAFKNVAKMTARSRCEFLGDDVKLRNAPGELLDHASIRGVIEYAK
jgi:hypothetical protein